MFLILFIIFGVSSAHHHNINNDDEDYYTELMQDYYRGMYEGSGFDGITREAPCSPYDEYLKAYHDGQAVVFGCHKGYCWSYCGASWNSDDWCWTQGSRGGPDNGKYLRCNTDADCCSQFGYEECGGRCSVF